jgi:hypothetical protein
MERGARVLLAIALVLAMMSGGAGQAQAYTKGVYETGCLVPYAIYSSSGDDTVVELNIEEFTSGAAIFWNFLSQDGVHIAHGSIPLQASTFSYSFSLAGSDANQHPNTVGYLIFTYDNDGILNFGEEHARLSVSALLLSIPNDDAAFIPTVPLTRNDYGSGPGGNVDLATLNGDSIQVAEYGFSGGSGYFDLSYWLDPGLEGSTLLIVWTSHRPAGSFIGTISTVNGDPPVGITLTPTFSNLNVFNAATDVAGRPATYVDGLITLHISDSEVEWPRFMFSLMWSGTFKAKQTFPAAQHHSS